MSGKNALLTAAVIIIAILLVKSLFDEEEKAALRKQVRDTKDLNKELRDMLLELIEKVKRGDQNIAQELASIVSLINVNEETSAMVKLTKVVEKLLKEIYGKDERVAEIAKTHGRKRPTLADLLERAKESRLLDQEDYHLLSVLKSIRNKEAHEVNIEKEPSRIIASLIAGIRFVFTLCHKTGRTSVEEVLV
ncbi:MAG TPA: hypothetical protein PKE21_15485 [Flavobacteriales bacterium]|nr:hypothetical protein [Flavobacteriales bacterium]HMR28884.1 hypothetical protein [Flavobacteriales bacterium]